MPPPLSRQRVNAAEFLQRSRSLPLHLKVLAMQRRPFDDQAHRSRWEVAGQHGLRVDGNTRLELGVLRVKMGRRMVAKVHLDDDAVEPTELRHRPTLWRTRETL